jgi:hypothetical protein
MSVAVSSGMGKTISAILVASVVWIGGCTMDQPGGGGGDDLAMSSSNDLAGGGGNHDLANGGGNHDLANGGGNPDLTGTPPQDLSMSSSTDLAGALLPLCATCTSNTECASGQCVPYMMGATMKCSNVCHTATATTDCPGINACNGMSYCKCQ